MGVTVREYRQSDRDALIRCVIGLQYYLAQLDPLGRMRTAEEFDAITYVDATLEKVRTGNGLLLLAEEPSDGSIVGCIVGTINDPDPCEALECRPLAALEGKILELFVAPDARGKHVGSALIERMEDFFRSRGCSAVWVECFAPNSVAHAFYGARGYADRSHWMLKTL